MKIQDIFDLPDLAVATGFTRSVSRLLSTRCKALSSLRNDTFDLEGPAARALADRLSTATKMRSPDGKMQAHLVLLDGRPLALNCQVQRQHVGEPNGDIHAIDVQAIDWLVAEVQKLRRPDPMLDMPMVNDDADLDHTLFAAIGPDNVFDAQAPGHVRCNESTGFAALDYRLPNHTGVTCLLSSYEDGSLAMQTTLTHITGLVETSFTRYTDHQAARMGFIIATGKAVAETEHTVFVRTTGGEFDVVCTGPGAWTVTRPGASGEYETVAADHKAIVAQLNSAVDSVLSTPSAPDPGLSR